MAKVSVCTLHPEAGTAAPEAACGGAGARWQADVAFSTLFTALAAALLASGAPRLGGPAALLPWAAHAAFSAMPALLALRCRAWCAPLRWSYQWSVCHGLAGDSA